MLGKLMKYEWKSTRRIFPLIYLVVLVFAVLSGFAVRSTLANSASIGGNGNEKAMVLFLGVYAILVIALLIVTIVVIIYRFYQSMLSQEGYLTHSLPVRKWQQIVSKLLMGFIWIVLAVVVICVSFAIIMGLSGTVQLVSQSFSFKIFIQQLGCSAPEIVLMLILFALGVIRLILQFYAAMSIGGSANSHKIAYSFLAFIVIVICANVIATIVGVGMLDNLSVTVYEYATSLPDSISLWGPSIVYNVCTSVVLFLITEYFLRKKLNLE